MAEEVEAKRFVAEPAVGTRGDEMVSDRRRRSASACSHLVEPYHGAQRLVRRAWRSAQRLGTDLDLLWVRRPGARLDDEAERSLNALQQLASLLGAELLIEESDDVAETIAGVARRRGTTYILMGRPRPARGLGRLRAPLALRLIELLPGVNLRIVADRARRRDEEER